MEIPFSHMGHTGRVMVTVAQTPAPGDLGARKGAQDLANCTAIIEYPGQGYQRLMGWVQMVCSTDNAFHGRQFEMDPFDPFGLDKRAPSPYCWYGITPTLFDAPSRGIRRKLNWVAHSFLAASPLSGNRRTVTPLAGFAWGFEIVDRKTCIMKPVTSLAGADWESHLPYLQSCYPGWRFTKMSSTAKR